MFIPGPECMKRLLTQGKSSFTGTCENVDLSLAKNKPVFSFVTVHYLYNPVWFSFNKGTLNHTVYSKIQNHQIWRFFW